MSRAGVQRGKNWYLDTDSRLGHGGTDTTIFNFGEGFPADRSLGGDWDGNGVDETGVYRFANAAWYLDTDGLPNHGGNDTSILDLVFVNPVALPSVNQTGTLPAQRSSASPPTPFTTIQESTSADLASNGRLNQDATPQASAEVRFEPARSAVKERTRLVDEAIDIDFEIDSLLW